MGAADLNERIAEQDAQIKPFKKASKSWMVEKVVALNTANKTMENFREGHILQQKQLQLKKQDSSRRLSVRLEKRQSKMNGIANAIGAGAKLKRQKQAQAQEVQPNEVQPDEAQPTAKDDGPQTKRKKMTKTKSRRTKQKQPQQNNTAAAAQPAAMRAAWLKAIPPGKTAFAFAQMEPKDKPTLVGVKMLKKLFAAKLRLNGTGPVLAGLATTGGMVELARFESFLKGEDAATRDCDL